VPAEHPDANVRRAIGMTTGNAVAEPLGDLK
jgi:hypothetical protein